MLFDKLILVFINCLRLTLDWISISKKTFTILQRQNTHRGRERRRAGISPLSLPSPFCCCKMIYIFLLKDIRSLGNLWIIFVEFQVSCTLLLISQPFKCYIFFLQLWRAKVLIFSISQCVWAHEGILDITIYLFTQQTWTLIKCLCVYCWSSSMSIHCIATILRGLTY